MATVFSHPLVAITLVPWFPKTTNRLAVVTTGLVLTVVPDMDVIGFYSGIPYEHVFGHRGISHSLVFSVVSSGIAAWLLFLLKQVAFKSGWFYLFLCMGSHGFIDAFTNGGLGIAFFVPFSNERYFFPFQPIEVSPLSVQSFFSSRGVPVIQSELIWVWLPCCVMWFFGRQMRPRTAIDT